MRSAKTISVSLPPEQFRKAVRLARRENLTVSELMSEALRRYPAGPPKAARQKPSATPAARAALARGLEAVQRDAECKGLHRLSLREINAAIASVRKSHRKPAAAVLA